MAVLITITIFFTILTMFVKLRYVVILYVIGNIVLYSYLVNSGQAGGWYILAVQVPTLVSSGIGILLIFFCQIIKYIWLESRETEPSTSENDDKKHNKQINQDK
ncbi:hypothetical protein A9Q81_13645 [Gammaproteobacteria bacterium 42_54_T18]|nr:hypothetical protein A9Q81_13645 [Gammaproteobacteria bacterium 42_54_T18]